MHQYINWQLLAYKYLIYEGVLAFLCLKPMPDESILFHNTRSRSHTKIRIPHIPACEVSNCRPFRLQKKCQSLYITSSQAFISFMNLRWMRNLSIYTIPCMHFSKLFWLCTFQSIYVGNFYKLQLAVAFPPAKTGTRLYMSIAYVYEWYIIIPSIGMTVWHFYHN